MATGWMKSLQCKSRAFDDVTPNHHHHHRRRRHDSNSSSDLSKAAHRLHSLSTSASCRNSFQNLKDIVETTTTTTTKPKKQKPPNQSPPPPPPFRRPAPVPPPRTRSASAESFFPSLTELPQGHPSRNVVEIIFHTGWGEKPFSGRVEMVFKVQNLNRTVARFEEYREMVKSRVAVAVAVDGGGEDFGDDQARCVADGNEVMRFYCLGATSGGGAYEAGCGAWELYGGKGAALCTYSGSGCAHEKGGGGSGRRAMLVCRVIAGRVYKENGYGPLLEGRVGYDSVNKESGELLVFDTRALLPCFLIIYNKL